jgi:hypothetical protein
MGSHSKTNRAVQRLRRLARRRREAGPKKDRPRRGDVMPHPPQPGETPA